MRKQPRVNRREEIGHDETLEGGCGGGGLCRPYPLLLLREDGEFSAEGGRAVRWGDMNAWRGAAVSVSRGRGFLGRLLLGEQLDFPDQRLHQLFRRHLAQ